jgi:prepilin-type N-terminal cleavage/methylation domain-containing protein
MASCTYSPGTPLIKNERGMTMIELMTSLLLFGMVTAIIYSFLLIGLSMYGRISAETQLRNQSDALYGQLTSELRDAISVKQGGSNLEIIYVKRAELAVDYLDSFKMVIDRVDPLDSNEPYGISIYNNLNALHKRIELTPKFSLDVSDDIAKPKSKLTARNEKLVEINLEFVRADQAIIQKVDKIDIKINSLIPLFRIE